MKRLLLFILSSTTILTQGCQTVDNQTTAEENPSALDSRGPILIGQETNLAALQAMSIGGLPPTKHEIRIPTLLIDAMQVGIKAAHLREGPGLQYAIGDRLLPEGSLVIVFDQIGPWKKAIPPEHGEGGWIHEDALRKPEADTTSIALDAKNLPTVFLRKNIKYVYEFPSKRKIDLRIRKGSQFPLLRSGKEYTLVWLQGTNSVVYLKRGDLDI